MLPKETQHTEFKPKFNEDVIETLVAFANTKGGRVFVGVDDKGKPLKNFTIGKESLQNWVNEVKQKTQPQIIPDAYIETIDNKDIAVFKVQEYPVKPVGTRSKYYKRVQNSNHLLSVQEIADIYMQSMQYSWDAYPARKYTYADLDENKIQKFIDKVNAVGRFSLAGTPYDCLEKLKFVDGDNVTNAAVLLFAKEGSEYNVHLGRFKTPSMIIDDKMLRLTLFNAVEETQKYLISQMKVAFEITGETTQRTEILEYPKPAIRELILNCLIHRDYLSPIDVQIKVFDNYITFYNPGKLYGDLTVEDLKTDNYQASARNKLIAEAFYLTGDIEKYGSGFRRIRQELDKYPTMQLVCAEIPNGFLATVSYTEQKTSTTIGVKSGVKSGVKEILLLIENTPTITTAEISKELDMPFRTIQRYIEHLKKDGVLSRENGKKGGYWKINKNWKEQIR
jgi:ATP-dependent DNA helicase RecG